MNTPSKHTPATIKATSIQAARLGGCNCDVEVSVTEELPSVWHAQVLHDSWCLLLQSRSAPWN